MRRAAFAVLSVPTGSSAEGDISVRLARPGARRLALLLVAVLAAGLAVAVTVSSVSRDHVTRSAASARLPVAAWGPVSRALGADDPAYRAAPAGAGLALRNPRQKLAARFSTAGVSIRSGALTVGLRLRGYGYGERVRALAAVAPTAEENRVLYRHGSVSEWYANGPLGLEQGFTLTARPASRGAGALTLALVLSGNARGVLARGRGGVTFSRDGSSISYRGLVVTDARGRTLPASLTLRGRELLLRVNDAGARYPLRVDPFIQQAKLTAADGAANDNLGFSVAVSGDTIVAGAPSATVNGNAAQGAVYVFLAPRRNWTNATPTAKLTIADGAAGDELGGAGIGSNDVGISGNTIVAGAAAGAVYVFVKPRGGWRSETETATLTPSDTPPPDNFGWSVGISGATIVAGSPFVTVNGNDSQGAAYVFVEPRGGWRDQTQTAKLTASDGAAVDNLGWSVGISGDTIVAGAQNATVNGNAQQGAVYVFVEPRRGWRDQTQTAKLTASDGAPGETLGLDVAISGDTIVAGEPDENGTPTPGAVYVFGEPRHGWQNETQIAELTSSDGVPGDLLGASVAIDGHTVVAGAPFATVNSNPFQGAAYVFAEPRRGWANETETAKLTASDGATNDGLGAMVGSSNETVVAGAPFATINGNAGQGAAYVFAPGWGDQPSIAENASQAGHTKAAATVRRPGRCTPDVARDRALAPLVLLGRSRNRPEC
jgi:hypothetical protein